MEEVGCIVPFLPSSISHQYPVCESNTTGSVAFNIYETLIEKQTYSKEEKGSFFISIEKFINRIYFQQSIFNVIVKIKRPCHFLEPFLEDVTIGQRLFPKNTTDSFVKLEFSVPRTVEVSI